MDSSGWLRVQPIYLDSRTNAMACIGTSDVNADGHQFEQALLVGRTKTRTNRTMLNSNGFVAERIVHWDYVAQVLFVLGAHVDRPQVRHLYAVSTNRTAAQRGEQCVTCASNAARDGHTYFDAHFGGGANKSLLVLESLGPAVPRYDVYEWQREQTESAPENSETNVLIEHRQSLQTNDQLRRRVSRIRLPTVRFETWPLGGKKAGGRVRMLLPPRWNSTAANDRAAKLPLLVHVRNREPGMFGGTTAWAVDWLSYVAVEMEVAVMEVDASGSSIQPIRRMFDVENHLGVTESHDLLASVRLALDKWPDRLDGRRVAIAGRGYGGFLAGWTMGHHVLGNDTDAPIRCAALVEPITDWEEYASVWSERYMGPRWGGDFRLLQRTSAWMGKSLLLVHPKAHEVPLVRMADELAQHLDELNLDYDFMLQPDVSDEELTKRRSMEQRLAEFVHRCLIDNCYF